MNNNPYTNQPPPPPNPSPTPANQTAEWFDSLPETTPPGAPKQSSTKLFIIIGSAMVIILLGGLVIFLGISQNCLTTSDLRELSGNSEIENAASASDNSLAYFIYFQSDSSLYDLTSDDTGPTVVKRIADFYKNHPNSPLRLTISSTFFTSDEQSLIMQRISKIKSDLLTAGIPESKITIADPEELDQEDDSQKTTTATITITSASTCK